MRNANGRGGAGRDEVMETKKCTRGARTVAEAKKILKALEVLKIDRDDIEIRAWGNWTARNGDYCFFTGTPLPIVETLGRLWGALNVIGEGLVDARPENDAANHGLIEISWNEI